MIRVSWKLVAIVPTKSFEEYKGNLTYIKHFVPLGERYTAEEEHAIETHPDFTE